MSKTPGNDQSSKGGHRRPPQSEIRGTSSKLVYQTGATRGGRPCMVACRVALCAMILCSFVPSSEARSLKKSSLNDVQKKLAELIATSGAETVAVAFYDLASGRELLINPDISFHAASTMKVPVMMEIYAQAAAGKLALDERVVIKNDFLSIADGSH